MGDPKQTELRFGPYSAPSVEYGDIVSDLRRGDVIISGMSKGLIQWPLGDVRKGKGRWLVLFGSLVDAVRNESCTAISHWWGVSMATVTKWRHALGVEQFTAATRQFKGRVCLVGEAWTEEEDSIVRSLTPKNAAETTGRTVIEVYDVDRKLGIKFP